MLYDLVAISDVFAQNFTPRVVRNFGLEYEDLRRIRPDVVAVSSTGYGYTGPWSAFGALGYTTEAASGLAHMTGYEGGPPAIPEIPYADYVAAEHTAFAIVAALLHRARTGVGQFIDVSQAETVSSTIPEALMDYTVNGRIGERIGNRHTTTAPHGCYPCRGEDRWIAIAVETDGQWRSLCEVLGIAAVGQDPRFADALSRWQHRLELDTLVGEKTREWDARDLMDALQASGVAAGAVLDGRDLLEDRHLNAREFYEKLDHHPDTGMPPLPYASRPWKFSRTPGGTRWSAPTMGEHNRLVLAEVLGRPETEVERLEREGVIGYAPVGAPAPTVMSLADQRRQGRILRYDEGHREWVQERYGG